MAASPLQSVSNSPFTFFLVEKTDFPEKNGVVREHKRPLVNPLNKATAEQSNSTHLSRDTYQSLSLDATVLHSLDE